MLVDKDKKITLEEFLLVDSQTDDLLEFIDGYVYSMASPSVIHQKIVTRLSTSLGVYFRGKKCEPMVSPFDIFLKNETETHRVQPDISIICDEKGYNEKNYVGSPTLVIEVLSPSTASKDLITKMNLYMRFGIKEYWIISPKNKEIQIFNFENYELQQELITFRANEILVSNIFPDLRIDLTEIFE